jgi:putative copper export protein
MNKRLAIFAAVDAAFTFTRQSADANGRKHHIDMRIKAVSIGVGAASTAAYFAINDWKSNWHKSSGLSRWRAWGITSIGCAAVSPMVATVVFDRPLTMREAHVMIGSCVVPIVGGWLVNEAYDAHPEWEPAAMPAAKMKHHGKKKKMM